MAKFRNIKFDLLTQIEGDLYDVVGYDMHCNSYLARAIVRHGVVREIFADTLQVMQYTFDISTDKDLLDAIKNDFEEGNKEPLNQAI